MWGVGAVPPTKVAEERTAIAAQRAVVALRDGVAALAGTDPDAAWAVVKVAAREWHYTAAGTPLRPYVAPKRMAHQGPPARWRLGSGGAMRTDRMWSRLDVRQYSCGGIGERAIHNAIDRITPPGAAGNPLGSGDPSGPSDPTWPGDLIISGDPMGSIDPVGSGDRLREPTGPCDPATPWAPAPS